MTTARLTMNIWTSGVCWALVAINARRHCKSRLADVLEPHRRIELVESMLSHVLRTASCCGAVEKVVVVSPECDGLDDTVVRVRDSGIGLNHAFELAREEARTAGAAEIVLLPADLPRLTVEDLELLVSAGRASGLAIAPDRRGTGTNGLYLRADSKFEFRFGTGSLAAHLAAARRDGIEPAIVHRLGLQEDVDAPTDLSDDQRFSVFQRSLPARQVGLHLRQALRRAPR